MADDMRADRFCSVGRFLMFLPGEKSPYQKLLCEVLADETASLPSSTQQILLGSDLRKMMYRYLEPQDWVRIVGNQVMDRRSGQLIWKANEISKLSSQQAHQLQASQLQASQLQASQSQASQSQLPKTAKPTRVLICQKSSCRQRGSGAVAQAIEGAIAQANHSQPIDLRATGCLKRCEAGPHVVMLPGGSYSQVTPAEGRSLIQSLLRRENRENR